MRHEGGGSDVMECRVYPCGGNRTVGMILTGEARNISSEISVRCCGPSEQTKGCEGRRRTARPFESRYALEQLRRRSQTLFRAERRADPCVLDLDRF